MAGLIVSEYILPVNISGHFIQFFHLIIRQLVNSRTQHLLYSCENHLSITSNKGQERLSLNRKRG
jgi:hypothetical protein